MPAFDLRLNGSAGTPVRFLRFDPNFLQPAQTYRFGRKSPGMFGSMESAMKNSEESRLLAADIPKHDFFWNVSFMLPKHEKAFERTSAMLYAPVLNDGLPALGNLPAESQDFVDDFIKTVSQVNIYFLDIEKERSTMEYWNSLHWARQNLKATDVGHTNHWFFSRISKYKENNKHGGQYSRFADSPKDLTIPPWLWDDKTSNDNFKCTFQHGYVVDTWRIKVSIDKFAADRDVVERLLPRDGTIVTVQVHSDGFSKCHARLYHRLDNGHPIILVVRNPPRWGAGQLQHGQQGVCSIHLTVPDINLAKELQALEVFSTRESAKEMPLNHFSLHEVVLSRMNPSRESRNFCKEFTNSTTELLEVYKDRMQFIADQLREPLNDRQKNAFDRALLGTHGALLVIEGCPGGGKTTLQAHIAIALYVMGKPVLVTAHSNPAVNELLTRVRAILTSAPPFLTHQRGKILRLHSSSCEESLLLELEGLLPQKQLLLEPEEGMDDDEVHPDLQEISLAHHLSQHCRSNLNDKDVQNYLHHRRTRDFNIVTPQLGHGDLKGACQSPYHEVKAELEKKIFGNVMILGTTMHTASGLAK
ncbi:hypothetical protein BDV96DRAFT_657432 [Lophiotrema nucula]|uniref:DNA2/NAM7 helicase helicase domain-containing protein n=1 Tax=Lophiotrema nucula TaxID=690887 RepID=A0A6A5ZEH8_9PLEO|nr:hypothetical protein BDV96DRAFT_657432 [Lophiotrema nucula]